MRHDRGDLDLEGEGLDPEAETQSLGSSETEAIRRAYLSRPRSRDWQTAIRVRRAFRPEARTGCGGGKSEGRARHSARPELPTVDEYGPRYLRDYKRRNKYSSYVSTRERLQPFFRDFAGRRLDIERIEAKDWTFGEGRWADQAPQRSGTLQAVVTMINYGIEEDDLPLPRATPFAVWGGGPRAGLRNHRQRQTSSSAC
jgi:hypothetical protein